MYENMNKWFNEEYNFWIGKGQDKDFAYDMGLSSALAIACGYYADEKVKVLWENYAELRHAKIHEIYD